MKKDKEINNDRLVVMLPTDLKEAFISSCKLVDDEPKTGGKTIRKLIRNFIYQVKQISK